MLIACTEIPVRSDINWGKHVCFGVMCRYVVHCGARFHIQEVQNSNLRSQAD